MKTVLIEALARVSKASASMDAIEQHANLSREGKAHAVPRFPDHRFICELRTSESLP
jgi:hypothetical protein